MDQHELDQLRQEIQRDIDEIERLNASLVAKMRELLAEERDQQT